MAKLSNRTKKSLLDVAIIITVLALMFAFFLFLALFLILGPTYLGVIIIVGIGMGAS